MKKLMTIMAAMMLTYSVQAQQVTLENARSEAASFFQSHGMSIAGGVKLSARAARRAQSTTAGTSTDAAYYIFNGAGGKGFVVISGDDRTEPILGYSTTDTYDAASIPPNMQAFLDGYAAQIAQMDASSAAAIRRVKKHAKIAPLIQTKWNQISPYNDLCPNDDDTRSYTGCEATSVAQIMAYHQWPKANTTAIPAYTTETKKINVPALPPVKFNWDAMPESGDKDQAVATLMRYVGQGEQMDYTSQGSNSNDGPAIYALKTYFGYDQNIKYYNRPSYTISEWDSIVYASLTESNPVLYGGNTTSGGHSFVCDGYDGNGLFHINWGWGGEHNSYFRLAVLNPHGTGSGGSVANSAYNMGVSAITGIQPPTGEKAEPEFIDCLGIDADTTTLSVDYNNYLMDNQDISYQCGWGEYDSNGKISAVTITEDPLKLKYGEDTSFTTDLTEASLAQGTYKLFPIIRIPNVTDWKRAFASNVYVQVDVDAAGQIKTTSFPDLDLTMDSIQFATPKTLPYQAHAFAHVTNNGEELNSTLYLFASQTDDWGKPADFTGAYIEANSKDSLEFYFKPKKAGTYHLALATDTLCTNIIGTQDVTICDTIPKYTMEMVSFKQLNDSTINMVIRNTSNMDYKKSVTLEFDKQNEDGHYISQKKAKVTQLILAGQTQTFTLWIPKIKSEGVYSYCIYYYLYSDSMFSDITYIAHDFSVTTGISSTPVAGNTTATRPYFSLEGMKMQNPTQKGIYIHNGQKVIR